MSTAGAGAEDDINLESLQLLKRIFEAADEDGSGELDIDEFCSRLGPHLGSNLSHQAVAQLFMKIDADAGGTVDWDEFTSYMLLQRAAESSTDSTAGAWRLFPEDPSRVMGGRPGAPGGGHHHDQVDRLLSCSQLDKVITCGRDGSVRLWNAPDLTHMRTLSTGGAWPTAVLFLPRARKLVVTAMDRSISYYDTNRGSYDLTGRVYATGAMGVPQALAVLSGDAGERVAYGDDRGSVLLLLCGSRELPARDLISTDAHKDYLHLHREHGNWVTQLDWVPEVGLVSSSLDASIKVFDIHRERVSHSCSHHAKGVHGFVWCAAYSCFASCGQERDVIVWHGSTGRKIGELRGHTSSVTQIALAEQLAAPQVFTLSLDRTIRVWDLRNHRCMQVICQDDWAVASDSQPTCCAYDSERRRLVTAVHRPVAWQHKAVTQDRTGHRAQLVAVLFNPLFDVIVSVDESGAVCVWNLQDGARSGRFTASHGGESGPVPHVTAAALDSNQRRLVTGANDGSVRLWNFNNGSLLRSFACDAATSEVCGLLFARDVRRGGDTLFAACWGGALLTWPDDEQELVTAAKAYEGHVEDVIALAAHTSRQLLASGDYDGRIHVWGLFSGERKATLCHRAERYETSVEVLVWLPAYSPAQRAAQAAEAAALSTAAALLTGCCEVVSCPVAAAAAPVDEHHQQQQPGVDCGNTPCRASVSGSEPGATAAARDEEEPEALLLLSGGGDGHVRVWDIDPVGQGTLLCVLPGAHGIMEAVSTMVVDADASILVLGDTAGHVRVFDISAGIDTHGDRSSVAASFVQRAHWLAHDGPVSSLAIVPPAHGGSQGDADCDTPCNLAGGHQSISGDDQSLGGGRQRMGDARASSSVGNNGNSCCAGKGHSGSSSCGTDCGRVAADSSKSATGPLVVSGGGQDVGSVAVWALDGSLVGMLGDHGWQLSRRSTWQDALSPAARPPRRERVNDTTADTAEACDALVARRPGAGANGPGQLLRGRAAAAAAGGQLGGHAGATAFLDSLPAAVRVLADAKQRAHDALTCTPDQVYGQLVLHGLSGVAAAAEPVLRSAAERRAARGVAAARTLFSSGSGHSSLAAASLSGGPSHPPGFNWRGR